MKGLVKHIKETLEQAGFLNHPNTTVLATSDDADDKLWSVLEDCSSSYGDGWMYVGVKYNKHNEPYDERHNIEGNEKDIVDLVGELINNCYEYRLSVFNEHKHSEPDFVLDIITADNVYYVVKISPDPDYSEDGDFDESQKPVKRNKRINEVREKFDPATEPAKAHWEKAIAAFKKAAKNGDVYVGEDGLGVRYKIGRDSTRWIILDYGKERLRDDECYVQHSRQLTRREMQTIISNLKRAGKQDYHLESWYDYFYGF